MAAFFPAGMQLAGIDAKLRQPLFNIQIWLSGKIILLRANILNRKKGMSVVGRAASSPPKQRIRKKSCGTC
jgi:hypothetical protein